MQADTISAIATPPGEGGIGIVRVSGATAAAIVDGIFIAKNKKSLTEIESHKVVYGHIVDPKHNMVVDEVIVISMKAPRSYTCEDVVEIHCHGGSMTLKKVLALTLDSGARLAEPGEFTKRAFLNGRLDLTQAQAVMDVIRAKTDHSLRMAMGQLQGAFSAKIGGYRHEILGLIAHLEAAIDFPEDDIEEIAVSEVSLTVEKISAELQHLLDTAHAGRILRDGLETAIVGKPNVGKSSLLNALLRENRAIVTDIPGTTRDVIEECADVGGVLLKIIDTAGIRETKDLVEQIGVEKARQYIARADLVLVLFDAGSPLSAEDEEILDLVQGCRSLVLINKSDLAEALDIAYIQNKLPNSRLIRISTLQGGGLDELERAIVEMVYQGEVQQEESVLVNQVRHVEILTAAQAALKEVLSAVSQDMPPDFIVIDLRAAWEKLGELTGDTVGEDIIDEIFSQFCIGK